MTEPPPNTVRHTVYTDSTIGLTVTAWPNPQPGQGGWLVRFLRRNTQFKLLDQTAEWLPRGDWDRWQWHPVGCGRVPPAALAAVEAWLQGQAKEAVK